VSELPLHGGNISGFLNEVPAHGVASVMGCVTLYAGQAACFVEHRIDPLGFRRPSPWGLVIGEGNSADDFHFLKSAALSFAI
jgi:hypothetical protein